jgi:predicted enzyme related to lactoylglutathione lyase
MSTTPSRFIRHDLMSTDPPAATRFYSELFGWKTTELKVMGFTVVRLLSEETVLGAIMPFGKELGFPSHWVPYVGVESVDECCKRVSGLGGDVCVPAMEIPPGRFAVVNDPQKAIFSPFTPKDGGQPPTGVASLRPPEGTFCWDELRTRDVDGAARFYTSLLGWGSKVVEMGSMERYTLFTDGDRPIAGALQTPADAPHPPAWLSYVAVGRLETTVERARTLGAAIAAPPADIPDVGRIAVLTDPTSARIAILEPKG